MEIQLDSLDFTTLTLKDETGNIVTLDLKAELAINEDNLDREMLEQPSKYVYWSAILERIKLFQENSDLELDLLMAELDQEAREVMTAPESKIKPTKDSVDAYIKRTEKFRIAKEKCNYYDYLARRINFIVRSFEQRKDMLQSYGRYITTERQYGHGAGRYQEKVDEHRFQNP